jgi:hypothetical protein
VNRSLRLLMSTWISTTVALAAIVGLFAFVYYMMRKAQREDTLRGQDSAEPGGFYTDFVGDVHYGERP